MNKGRVAEGLNKGKEEGDEGLNKGKEEGAEGSASGKEEDSDGLNRREKGSKK